MKKTKAKVVDQSMSTGYDEMYCEFFKCPSCGESYVAKGFKFCPDCGAKLIWKTVDK